MTDEKRENARKLQRAEDSPNFADDPAVRDMLVRLDQLERQTDPQHPDSESDKDASANKALRIVSELGAYVAGWAIDHKIGLAIEGRGNIPDLAIQARRPAYTELREQVNSHRHEAAGRSPGLTRQVQRKALSNILNAMASPFCESIFDPLAEALEALEYGETLPLLEPARDGRKRKFRELKLQLLALCFVEYQRTLGRRVDQLESDVKDAFCVSESTVRGWKRQLKTQLDPFNVDNALLRAEHCGKVDRADGGARFEQTLGLKALKKWGSQYKAIQRFNDQK